MKRYLFLISFVAVLTASLIPFNVLAAPACKDECPNVFVPYFCDYSWTIENGSASKGDLHCGSWFIVPEAPGLEENWGKYYWIPSICSVGAGYDETTEKYYLIGMCEY